MSLDKVNILLPPVWSGVYLNVAKLMQYQLLEANINADILEAGAQHQQADFSIVLGWHLLTSTTNIASPYILYQLEPLVLPFWQEKLQENISLFREAVCIWDYSESNAPFLTQHDLTCYIKPLGYHHQMADVQHASYSDFDVMFVGFVTERRKRLLNTLTQYCSVSVQQKWGKDYTEALGRSKILLNLHQHDMPTPLEQARIAYALNNQVCVISESCSDAPYPDLPYFDYQNIVEQVLYYLHHQEERMQLKQHTYDTFKQYQYNFDFAGLINEITYSA